MTVILYSKSWQLIIVSLRGVFGIRREDSKPGAGGWDLHCEACSRRLRRRCTSSGVSFHAMFVVICSYGALVNGAGSMEVEASSLVRAGISGGGVTTESSSMNIFPSCRYGFFLSYISGLMSVVSMV